MAARDGGAPAFDPRILNLYCVDSVIYRDNKVIPNNDYEYDPQGEPFTFENCDNVSVDAK